MPVTVTNWCSRGTIVKITGTIVKITGHQSSYRGSANDVKVQGKVGDTGAVMGGNFGNSVGGASGRSSARYSEGRGFSEYGDNDDH